MASPTQPACTRVDPGMISVGDRVRSVAPGHSADCRQREGIVTEIGVDSTGRYGWLQLRDVDGYSRSYWLRSMADWWLLS